MPARYPTQRRKPRVFQKKISLGLQPGLRPTAPEDFGILSSPGRDRSCSLVKPLFHQNSHCIQWNGCPSRNLIRTEDRTRMCTWSASRPWEVWLKEPWRRRHSHPGHPQAPSAGVYPRQREDSGSPSPLTEVQPLPGFGRSHLQSHTGFYTDMTALKCYILMAKLCTCTKSSLAWFEAKLWAKMKLQGTGKLLHARTWGWGSSIPKSLGLLFANIIYSN